MKNSLFLKFIFAIILIALISQISTKDSPEKWTMYKKKPLKEIKYLYQQKQYIFENIVDHFDYQTEKFWNQRYWVISDYFNRTSGPVYLFICGQWICSGVPEARAWLVALAQQTGGLILTLEHRFYGKSLPFGNDSFKLENMKFLTSQQALSDLAYFLTDVKQKEMFGISDNPWICVGGSYPGALSAWFRGKYPHLVIGGIASSAVVQSMQNFYMFDEQMYLSANKSGDWCWKAINRTNADVQVILKHSNAQPFKKLFPGGQHLKNDEFMFFWIDSIVMMIQYGGRSQMCNDIQGKSDSQQFNYFIDNAKKHPVYEYGSYYLKNETFAVETGQAQRAWYYQSCTQFGYWQTPSIIHPLRSSWIGIDFYKRFCADSYGVGTWPEVDRKNTETGGWNITTSNLLMSNGDEDPWKWVSILKPQGNIIARQANCTDCAHCVDLNTPSQDDSNELKQIRSEQLQTVRKWIIEYWNSKKRMNLQKILIE